MHMIVSAVLTSAIVNILLFGIIYILFLNKNKGLSQKLEEIKQLLMSFLLSFALSVIIQLAFIILLSQLSVNFSSLDIPCATILSLALGILIAKNGGHINTVTNEKLQKVIILLAKTALIIVILECSVFNYSAYSSRGGENTVIPFDGTELTDEAKLEKSAISISSNSECILNIPVAKADVKNIAVTLTDSFGGKIVDITAAIKDLNLSQDYTAVDSVKGYAANKSVVYLTVNAHKLTSLRLIFNRAAGVTVNSVAYNVSQPFSVNYLRLFGILILAAVVIVIKVFSLHKIKLDLSHNKQWVSAATALIICLAMCIVLFGFYSGNALNPYRVGNDMTSAPIYQQQFDALYKGQLNLDIPVDNKLVEAGDSAYDPQYRNVNGISSYWDHAFYNGKYYCYFGIAPVLMLYVPTYALTGCLPSNTLACAFFGTLCVLFGFMAVWQIAKNFAKKPNFLLTVLCSMTFPLITGMYFVQFDANMYSIPKLSAFAFLFLLVYMTLSAYRNPKWWKLLICGLCVVIIAGSRPTIILTALALAPFYIGILLSKKIKTSRKIGYVLTFLMPVLAGALMLMIYNYLRFDSPFEFGAKYQLTMNNIAFNNISAGFIGFALFHYFLQPITVNNTFPYISPSLYSFGDYSRYVYSANSYGVFAFPVNLAILGFPAIRKKAKMTLVCRSFVICVAVLSVITALINFSMAGVIISYTLDIMPMITLVAMGLIFTAEERLRTNPYMHKVFYIVIGIVIIISAALGMALLLTSNFKNAWNYASPVYNYIQDAFSF